MSPGDSRKRKVEIVSKEILISRADLGVTRISPGSKSPSPGEGQALVEVERFGLTANNVSYAATGDALGYWGYFPAEEGWGRLPVWGFGRVIESNAQDVAVGEQIFGYLPLSSHLVIRPDGVGPLCFSDATPHRAALHPWYNRYYRCSADPVYSEQDAPVQPVLWALFMTGWMLGHELSGAVERVYVSSASSKTALALAWAMAQLNSGTRCVGITSSANRDFVRALGIYADVLTYDSLGALEETKRAAYVDIAGNAAATSAAHVALGDHLVDSVLLGATHRAPAPTPLPMPGPAPRFFFIPSVAEERAADEGLAAYHQRFADAWHSFATWAQGWLEIETGRGAGAIEAAYQRIVAGDVPPQRASVFSWV